jgi:hypothetical protein
LAARLDKAHKAPKRSCTTWVYEVTVREYSALKIRLDSGYTTHLHLPDPATVVEHGPRPDPVSHCDYPAWLRPTGWQCRRCGADLTPRWEPPMTVKREDLVRAVIAAWDAQFTRPAELGLDYRQAVAAVDTVLAGVAGECTCGATMTDGGMGSAHLDWCASLDPDGPTAPRRRHEHQSGHDPFTGRVPGCWFCTHWRHPADRS